MKHVIERFLKMTSDEVLDCFARLPGARVYKEFVYIPGTRADNRLLLVGHADTACGNKPPRGVKWYGNLARCGDSYTLITGPAYTGVAQAPPAPVVVVPATENLEEVAKTAADANPNPGEKTVVAAAVTEEKTKGKGKAKSEKKIAKAKKEFVWDEVHQKAVVIVGTERLDIDEYRRRMAGEGFAEATTTKQTTHNNNSYSRYQGNSNNYNSCLGADDRVGIAVLWLMRNSGHSLLVTDKEESGGHGARAAVKEIAEELFEHQFAIEVDRMNDQEMVFYQVSTPEFEKFMKEQTGFRIDRGSYTDIADVCMGAGICGVNLAAGYWGQHTSSETFSYDCWLRTLNVVRRFCFERENTEKFLLPQKAPANPSVPPARTPTATTTAPTSPVAAGGDIGPLFNGKPTVGTSPYKDGPRFPGAKAETTKTGVAITTTTIDPATHTKTVVTEIMNENGEVPAIFPEGSTPIKQALLDAERAAQHAEGVAGLGILDLQLQNAPIH